MNTTICPECASRHVSPPDREGLIDCYDCGIWWQPDHPNNQVRIPAPEEDSHG